MSEKKNMNAVRKFNIISVLVYGYKLKRKKFPSTILIGRNFNKILYLRR